MAKRRLHDIHRHGFKGGFSKGVPQPVSGCRAELRAVDRILLIREKRCFLKKFFQYAVKSGAGEGVCRVLRPLSLSEIREKRGSLGAASDRGEAPGSSDRR